MKLLTGGNFKGNPQLFEYFDKSKRVPNHGEN